MFSGNRAPLGPAVSNTAEVTITSAAFRNNTLLCDDVDGSMFLDWQTVSSEKLDQMSEGDLLATYIHAHGQSRCASAGGWLRVAGRWCGVKGDYQLAKILGVS